MLDGKLSLLTAFSERFSLGKVEGGRENMDYGEQKVDAESMDEYGDSDNERKVEDWRENMDDQDVQDNFDDSDNDKIVRRV